MSALLPRPRATLHPHQLRGELVQRHRRVDEGDEEVAVLSGHEPPVPRRPERLQLADARERLPAAGPTQLRGCMGDPRFSARPSRVRSDRDGESVSAGGRAVAIGISRRDPQ